nr:T9SS type A sorting domain-containing protein [Chryseolinea sp.]
CKGTFQLPSKFIISLAAPGASVQHLYEFDGFTFIPLASIEPTSQIVLLNDQLYFITRTPSGRKLNVFNGTSATEIVGISFPDLRFSLISAGGFLYIDGSDGFREERYVYRFDGTSLRVLPGLFSAGSDIRDVYPIGTTGNAYFRHDLSMSYCDGTTITPVRYPSGHLVDAPYESVVYQDRLYLGSGGSSLVQCVAAIATLISLPDGAVALPGVHTVYRDELYLSAELHDRSYVYRFDGTTFTSVFEYPRYVVTPSLSNRDGNLIIIPEPRHDTEVYEYEGSTVTTITSPVSGIARTLESTTCYHTWLIATSSGYRVAKERRYGDGTCDEGASIIPPELAGFNRFDINLYSRERDWCWTGIDIVWEIEPICITPPCAPLSVQAKLTDKQGKVAWQKISDKPFLENFPADKPYTLSIGVGKDKSIAQVFDFDQNLVNKGIEEISMSILPGEKYFYLTANTKNKEKIPFTLTLLNTKGESVWQQNFEAPMDERIRAFTSKPGNYLRFSIPEENSSVAFYPNPFQGSITIEAKELDIPMTISLSDLNGKVITQRVMDQTGTYTLDAYNQKPGLYILTLSGKQIRRELVQLKK